MDIRVERLEDRPAIAAVEESAFGKPGVARMVDAIRASDGFVPGLSLVAVDECIVVGHVMVSYVGLKESRTRLLELGPLGVAPNRQGAGVGSALVWAALGAADARAEPLVLVLGHPTYYPRFGFKRASRFGINPPAGIPDEAFMLAPLEAYDPALRGTVEFPPAYALGR